MNSCKNIFNPIVHPYVKANFLSRLSFFYIKDLVKKYFKEKLDEGNLYQTLPNLSSQKLGDELEEILAIYSKTDRLLVMKILIRRFAKPCILITTLYLMLYLIRTHLEPFLMSKILANFTMSGKDDSTFHVALVAAISLVLFFIISNLFISYSIFLINIVIIQMGVGLSSLIYRKALRLRSSNKLNKISESGNVVTLITKDVLIFENLIPFLLSVTYFIICFVLVTILICQKAGVVGLCSSAIIVVTILFQMLLCKETYKKRVKVALDTASRTEIIREALTAIRIIKMYTWEAHFIKKVGNIRKKEMKGIFILYLLKSLIWVLGNVCSTADFYVFFVVYIYVHKTINTETFYYIMIVLNGIKFHLNIVLPMGISGLGELLASFKRIQEFLALDEVLIRDVNVDDKPKIVIDGTIIDSLLDISLNVQDKGLILIYGPTSSGKSVLFKAILGEHPVKGTLEVTGKLSYASQETWIFPSTIKQNIVFGNSFEQERYDKILDICALQYDLKHLEKGDEAILVDGGANLSNGQRARINLARALYHKADIYLLDDSFSALDLEVSALVYQKCIDFLKDKIALVVVQNKFYLPEDHEKKINSSRNGRIQISEISLELGTRIFNNELDTNKFNAFVGDGAQIRLNDETETDNLIMNTLNYSNLYYEDIKTKSIAFNTFKKYCKQCGGYFTCSFVLFVFILFEICNTLNYKFVSIWTNAEEKFLNFKSNMSSYREQEYYKILNHRNTYFYAFNAAFIFSVIFGLLRAVLHFYIASKASARIHEDMLKSVINAEVVFFDTHLLGNIINRFSKDTYNLDENLPINLFKVIMMHLEIIGLFALIASTNLIFLLVTCFVLTIMILLLKYVFFPLLSNLKRLESAAHSPMVGYLNTSITGLYTIRVHGIQKQLQQEFDKHQDLFSSAYINVIAAERAFGVIVDLLCCTFMSLTIIYFFINESNVSSADVGLVVSTFFRLFGMVNSMYRQLMEVLAFLTSVERIFDYTLIKSEKSSGMELNDWPNNGCIEFQHVFLTYPTNNVKALKNINFKIGEKEKIAVLGRTGSGKSSLISALFQFYEFKGRILIDEVDIKYLSLNYRSKIGIIPQEPVIFSGSLRKNLDPFKKYSNEEIWKYVKKVQLPIKHLNDDLHSLNLSTGQKQLVSLVRVLLEKKKVVILDEATSNIDKETESTICNLLNENLAECTVLNITHKFKSLNNCKILTLNSGQIISNT